MVTESFCWILLWSRGG